MATPENKLAFDGGWEYDPAPESTDHVRIEKRYGSDENRLAGRNDELDCTNDL